MLTKALKSFKAKDGLVWSARVGGGGGVFLEYLGGDVQLGPRNPRPIQDYKKQLNSAALSYSPNPSLS